MMNLNFGIELETVGLDHAGLARAIQGALGGTVDDRHRVIDGKGRTWCVVHDGSLEGAFSGEVVSPVLAYEDIDDLQQVVRALRHAGARAHASAGIHIHVSHPDLDAGAIGRLLKMVHKQEELIHHALGIREQRLQRYCKPVDAEVLRRIEAARPKSAEDLKAAWYGSRNARVCRYDCSRYRGVNLNSWFYRKTIEFRYFESTLHAGEVKAYVQFVLALVQAAMKAKAASSKRREFQPASARYDFRVFLLRLGLIGPEFKTARMHLMKRLEGSAAWKHGRPEAKPAPEAAP